MMGSYSLLLYSKVQYSMYLCARYVADHVPFMDEKYQKLAENFQTKFSYPLISLQESKEDVFERLTKTFPLVAHHLFYHNCFDKQIWTDKRENWRGIDGEFLLIFVLNL